MMPPSPKVLILLLSSVSLLSGCAPAQPKPVVQADPPADAMPMTMSAPIEPVEVQPMDSDPVNERLARLEQSVGGLETDMAELQADMTDAKPRLAKLDTMEKHFRQLSLELDRINSTYDIPPAMAPVPVKPVPAPAPKPVAAKPAVKASAPAAAPKKVSGPLKVEKVRVGEQGNGKTRIVLDTTGPAKITHDIDNTEKILVIELPGAAWAASTAQTLKSSPLVSSYKAESDASGSRLIAQLKAAVQVTSTSSLKPEGGSGYRVFLDLAKK